MSDPIVSRVYRDGVMESMHCAVFAISDPAGRIIWSGGDIDRPVYIRSCSKIFQTLPIIETGAADRFGLTDAEIAIITSSHSGEPIHQQTVRSILTKIGKSESDLLCGAQPPYADAYRRSMYAARESFGVIHNNCSGKHAGMLALALHIGVPTEGYLEPTHPVQVLMKGAYCRVAGVSESEVAIGHDGCDAPAFVTTTRAAARGAARIADPSSLPEESLRTAVERVYRSVSANPYLIGGAARFCTAFNQAASGRAIGKVGAEAMYLIADRSHKTGIVMKLNDGATRGMFPFVAAMALKLGIIKEPLSPEMAEFLHPVIKNYVGRPIGTVEVPPELIDSLPV
ncbi:MAG: asparaginase [Candidatus Brocadiia bacterium]